MDRLRSELEPDRLLESPAAKPPLLTLRDRGWGEWHRGERHRNEAHHSDRAAESATGPRRRPNRTALRVRARRTASRVRRR